MAKASNLVRPLVRRLHAYVPGEQPKIPGLVKLNTNENPYPPSPKVLAAVKKAVDARLRLYPNPGSDALREKLARLHRCSPDNIIVGNGSDELLEMATRAFVEPYSGKGRKSPSTVQFFDPSYSLYPVLADMHGALQNPVPLRKDFSLPSPKALRAERLWDFQAALSIITTPNAPSGRGYTRADLEPICRLQRGVVVLDETYIDFADQDALQLGLEYPNVLVGRTFSKAYSLCFLRIGYFLGNPELIAALHKIRDSYNVNGLAQVAAVATLDNLDYYRHNFHRIVVSRERLSIKLHELGFVVCPSQTNFIFVRPPRFPAKTWLQKLRDRKILVRWFDAPGVCDYLRITIGTEAEVSALLRATIEILKN